MVRFVLTSVLVSFALCAAGVSQSLVGDHVLAADAPAFVQRDSSAIVRQGGGMLIDASAPAQAMSPASGHRASLFAEGAGAGLFSNGAPRSLLHRGPVLNRAITTRGVAGLRDFIASAEAGRAGYDAVQYGARIRPGKPPTQMRIREILAWIRATPGQPHAIGRYQFIPPTLRRLVRELGVSPQAYFTPDVQDRLADELLREAGLQGFLDGQIGQVQFMDNIAKIWAGLPNSTGRSHYHGYAGNKAVVSWRQFDAAMDRLFRG